MGEVHTVMRQIARGPLRFLFVAAGALPLLTLIATPVQAADLTITTTYPTIQVDPGGQVKLPLNVQTAIPQVVDLSVVSVPDGWTATFHGGGFIVSSVSTAGSVASPAPLDLTLQVSVPQTATPNDYKFTVHAAAGGFTADLPIDLKVATSQGGSVTLTTDVPAKRGAPGAAVSFSLTLHNDTATEQTFTLSVPDAPDGWKVTAQPSDAQATSFKVAAGDTSSVSVSATSPADATAGQYTFTIVASAGTNVGAQGQLGVELAGNQSISVTSPTGILNTTATAGSPTSYAVQVVNSGSAPLTNVSLTSTPPTKWQVTFSPTTIASLNPGDTASVTAAIQPPNDAVAGDYVVTLAAGSGTANDSITVRTTVQTSTIWGYVGLGLIAVVVIGLLLVFRQFGRR
jgi:uncharacterized repeat protein (TIGR01451 family)